MKWGEGVLTLQISHEPLELEGLGPLLPTDDRSSVFGGQGPCCPPWPPQPAPETPTAACLLAAGRASAVASSVQWGDQFQGLPTQPSSLNLLSLPVLKAVFTINKILGQQA